MLVSSLFIFWFDSLWCFGFFDSISNLRDSIFLSFLMAVSLIFMSVCLLI